MLIQSMILLECENNCLAIITIIAVVKLSKCDNGFTAASGISTTYVNKNMLFFFFDSSCYVTNVAYRCSDARTNADTRGCLTALIFLCETCFPGSTK